MAVAYCDIQVALLKIMTEIAGERVTICNLSPLRGAHLPHSISPSLHARASMSVSVCIGSGTGRGDSQTRLRFPLKLLISCSVVLT